MALEDAEVSAESDLVLRAKNGDYQGYAAIADKQRNR